MKRHSVSDVPAAAGRFLTALAAQTPSEQHRFLVAVSGGLDSMVLLHLVTHWSAAHDWQTYAAHYNHQLRGTASDGDAAFVQEQCGLRGVPLTVGRGDVRGAAAAHGWSLETAARNLRYDFLEETARSQGCAWILTAHHADDNAETMLLNWIRGSGSHGLAGIPAIRGRVARPLLTIPRAALEACARDWAIPHVEDATNADPDAASRNLLRHQVLPVLRKINPRAVENMVRTAGLLSREDAALGWYAQMLEGRVSQTEAGLRIARQTLLEVPAAVAGRTILNLLERTGGHREDLAEVHVDAVLALAGSSRRCGELQLPCRIRVELEEGALLFRQVPPEEAAAVIAVGTSVHYNDWTVALTAESIPGSWPLALPDGPLRVTGWRSRDRMTLAGGQSSRTLKRLCAERGLSPGWRDQVPVLRAGEDPIAVPGLGVDVGAAPRPDRQTVYVSFVMSNKRKEEESHAQ